MTYLETINEVLKRLRQPSVSTVMENDYSMLIGALVNDAKREVEDSWNWLALQASVMISAASGTDSYTLTGFGPRGRVHRVHNTTSPESEIRSIDWYRFQRWEDLTTVADNRPSWWRINGLDGEDGIIQFYPTPDASYTIYAYGIAPQADLVSEGTEITVPYYPVLLGAYAMAVAERGDDRGNIPSVAQRAYEQALSDAIAFDSGNRNSGYESDWTVV